MNYPVYGVFRSLPEGEQAQATLRSSGFRDVSLSQLTDEHMAILGTAKENRRKLTHVFIGNALGLLIGGGLGFMLGIGFGILWGLVGGAILGAAGAGIGILAANRNISRFQRYLDSGGVLVRVESSDTAKSADQAIQILQVSGAAEATGTTPGGSPEEGS